MLIFIIEPRRVGIEAMLIVNVTSIEYSTNLTDLRTYFLVAYHLISLKT